MKAARAATAGIALGMALGMALGWAAPASAQESVFNLAGFGLPASGESARSRGVGGAGFVLPGDVFASENPAVLARFDQAGLYLSLLGARTRVEDPATEGGFDDVVFPLAQAVVPAGRAGLGLGYQQFVDFDARLASRIVFEGDSLPVTLDSEGGLGVLSPAAAYAIDGRTRIGGSLDFYVGSREDVRAVETADGSGDPVSTADTLVHDYRGIGFTLGLERELGENLRISAAYRLRPGITSEITAASSQGLEGREREIEVPSEVVIGASGSLSPVLTLAGQLRYADWEGFESDAPGSASFTSALEVGGGIELAPRSTTGLIFGPQAPLLAGFRWRRLPIELNGEVVSEWTAGVGYSRRFGDTGAVGSRLDLAFEYGQRGSIDEHGLSERILRLAVGVAVFEPWRAIGD